MSRKEKNNSPKKNKSSLASIINSFVIISIFVILASIAFYFTFKDSQEIDMLSLANKYLNRRTEEDFLSPYKELTKNKEQQNKQEPKQICIAEGYFYQLHWVNQIKYNVATQQEVLPLLSLYNLIFSYNNKVESYVKRLSKIFSKNEVYDLATIRDKYNKLRQEVVRELYMNKFNNSILLKWFLKIVNVQNRGTRAIKAGEPESILEIAYQHLDDGQILEAYKLIEPLDETYHEIVFDWLEYTKKHLEAEAITTEMYVYVNSNEYKKNFIKGCQ